MYIRADTRMRRARWHGAACPCTGMCAHARTHARAWYSNLGAHIIQSYACCMQNMGIQAHTRVPVTGTSRTRTHDRAISHTHKHVRRRSRTHTHTHTRRHAYTLPLSKAPANAYTLYTFRNPCACVWLLTDGIALDGWMDGRKNKDGPTDGLTDGRTSGEMSGQRLVGPATGRDTRRGRRGRPRHHAHGERSSTLPLESLCAPPHVPSNACTPLQSPSTPPFPIPPTQLILLSSIGLAFQRSAWSAGLSEVRRRRGRD